MPNTEPIEKQLASLVTADIHQIFSPLHEPIRSGTLCALQLNAVAVMIVAGRHRDGLQGVENRPMPTNIFAAAWKDLTSAVPLLGPVIQ